MSGMAMATVADILDRVSNVAGRRLIKTSCISKAQTFNARTHTRGHFDTRPNSKHRTRFVCKKRKELDDLCSVVRPEKHLEVTKYD